MYDGYDDARHAMPSDLVTVHIENTNLADYGVDAGDYVIINRLLEPADGQLGLVRYTRGGPQSVVAPVFFQGSGEQAYCLLVLADDPLVLGPEDHLEIAGKVIGVQHYFG